MKNFITILACVAMGNTAIAQCPDQASITSSNKCISIVYASPVPLPAYLVYNGIQYNYNGGTGTGASPAIYRDPAATGSCGSYSGASATITLSSGQVCNYASGLLPLYWINVNGSVNNSRLAQISWQVQENNVTGYWLEKSTDGSLFTTIATLASKGNGTNNYEYTDTASVQGVAFYRIKQKDRDGRTSYSAIIKLYNIDKVPFTVYPNPVKDAASISGAVIGTKAVLTDISGKVLQRISFTQPASVINLSAYSSGIYFLKVNNGVTQKIIKQ
jgi:hypothetical protein